MAGHITTRRGPDVPRGPDVVHHCFTLQAPRKALDHNIIEPILGSKNSCKCNRDLELYKESLSSPTEVGLFSDSCNSIHCNLFAITNKLQWRVKEKSLYKSVASCRRY